MWIRKNCTLIHIQAHEDHTDEAFLAWWLGIAALAYSGCGQTGPDYGSLDLCSVQGTVTLDGVPLGKSLRAVRSRGQDVFLRTDGQQRPLRIGRNSAETGALKGSKTVRIWSALESLRGGSGRGWRRR